MKPSELSKRWIRRFKPTAQAALHRVIDHHLRAATRNFNRLDFEAPRARAEHKERLRADAAATLATCKSLVAAWRQVFRRDRREMRRAGAALEEARRRHRQFLNKLDG